VKKEKIKRNKMARHPYEILEEMVGLAPNTTLTGQGPHPNWIKYCTLSGELSGSVISHSSLWSTTDFRSYHNCREMCLGVISGRATKEDLEKLFATIPAPEPAVA
jgi:hypothetical protein